MRGRFFPRVGVLLLLVAWAGSAGAEICQIDAVPAATLLLPYFEIDLGKNPRRAEDTVLSINNSGPAPVIAHVALWTDMSVGTLNFDIFLTGYDTQAFSLGALFYDGLLPATLDDQSPVGGLTDLEDLRDAHTGDPVDGLCYGRPSGRIARGYVTIDSVVQQSVLFRSDEGYFDFADGENQLWGQYYVVKSSYIQSENLVSIEASSSSQLGSNDYTFYGRYVGFDGTDDREPLGTQWGARYFSEGRTKTHLIVWRDSGVAQQPFTCNGLEGGWYPLGQNEVIILNENEDAVELFIEDGEFAFAAETQQVQIDTSAFPSPFDSGWVWLDLGTEGGLQSIVVVRQDFRKRRSRHMAQPFDRFTGAFSGTCRPAPTVSAGPVP